MLCNPRIEVGLIDAKKKKSTRAESTSTKSEFLIIITLDIINNQLTRSLTKVSSPFLKMHGRLRKVIQPHAKKMASCGVYVRNLSLTSTELDDFYDVVVNGASIVGAFYAASLVKKLGPGALKIAIIDIKPPTDLLLDSEQPDVRVYALSPVSISLLEKVGAWQHIKSRSQAYSKMQVSTSLSNFLFLSVCLSVALLLSLLSSSHNTIKLTSLTL